LHIPAINPFRRGKVAKKEVSYDAFLKETVSLIANNGALLVTQHREDKPNVMTIGWGLVGIVWGLPIFTVLVRPSRFTYRRVDESGEFTVNIPYPSMSETVLYCGTVSGRNNDKFKEKSLTPIPSKTVSSPLIAQCAIHYECKTVHKNDIASGTFPDSINDEFYPENDFHRVFYGRILRTSADSPFSETLV
jgi:flavin reductase (DIM6/NTAB) family NADH-FMN oxidoreductase RutF